VTALSENEISKRCVTTAIAVCFAHILTIAGTLYQEQSIIVWSRTAPVGQMLWFAVVNYGTFLSPVFVLLIIRRVCILVGIFAIPVLIFFVLRMHHVFQFYWSGINSMAVQKGDALSFLTMVFEMLSAVIVAPMLLFIFLWKRTWRS
jgi:hypothetical protein